MRVDLTTAARADIAEIGAYIRSDNPARAATFEQELVSACEAISDLPLGWPMVPRYEHIGYRRKAYKQYLIFYRLSADRIEIVRILHGRRDIERLLFPSDA